jgi:hypothetical protein
LGPLRSPAGINPLATKATTFLFPIAHHFVTERPSVAQNHAQVTTPPLFKKSPRKFSSTPQPLIQAPSSHFRIFLECSSNKLAA